MSDTTEERLIIVPTFMTRDDGTAYVIVTEMHKIDGSYVQLDPVEMTHDEYAVLMAEHFDAQGTA